MSKCLRCGKSLDDRRAGAKYCGAACRKAGFVAKTTGTMPSTKRGGARAGAGRPPKGKPKPVVAPKVKSKVKPKPAQKSKERLPDYIYRIEIKITDRTETIYHVGGSYDKRIVEHHILRYEVFTQDKQRYIHGFHYESALLAEDPAFEGLVWQWNRNKIAREARCFLKRDNNLGGLVLDKHNSQVWGFTDEPHFSQRVLETRWRKEKAKTEAAKEARRKEKVELDKWFEDFTAPRIKALRVLGLAEDASRNDIKLAYRKLATLHHPDKGGDKQAFVELRDAYELLNR